MNFDKEYFIKILAKANNTTEKKILSQYSGFNAYEQLVYEPFVGLSNASNYNLSYARINKENFQDTIREVPLNKNKPIKKILILGGSVAFGFGANSHSQNITNYLYEYLNNKDNTKRWEILNYSFVSCQTTSEMNIINKTIKKHKPDYVIQLSGFNDFYFYLNSNFQLYTYNQSQQIKDYLYSSFFSKFIKKLSLYSFLFKIIYKLLYTRSNIKKNNNIYTIY